MRPMTGIPHTRSRPPLHRGAHRRVLVAGVLLSASSLAGCSLPSTDGPPTESDPTEAPIASSTPDPGRAALITEVERLQVTVGTARDALARAVDAEGRAAADDAAEAALDVLVAAVDARGSEHGDGPRPLFPAETLDRDESEDAADQLTATLTRARDVGGTVGNTVIDLLRDPIAGDLGAWQRDAAGVLASIDATLSDASTLEELVVAVGELPGLGTRAVAWARLTADASSVDDARAYAEQGVANLEVIQITLDRLELAA